MRIQKILYPYLKANKNPFQSNMQDTSFDASNQIFAKVSNDSFIKSTVEYTGDDKKFAQIVNDAPRDKKGRIVLSKEDKNQINKLNVECPILKDLKDSVA